MNSDLFEEVVALKPDDVSMSSFLVKLVEAGIGLPSPYEEIATREMKINYAVNTKKLEAAVKEDEVKPQEALRISGRATTFNQIIEKHKVELDKKYG
jgi:hypothetical protein